MAQFYFSEKEYYLLPFEYINANGVGEQGQQVAAEDIWRTNDTRITETCIFDSAFLIIVYKSPLLTTMDNHYAVAAGVRMGASSFQIPS